MGGIKRRKSKKKLNRRVAAYEEHGPNPQPPHNPSNSTGRGHDMRRPGSNRK